MANAIYPKYKEAVMQHAANSSLTGTVKCALVDTGTYTYSSSHEFLSSLTGVVGTAQTITNKTFVNGIFDGDNVTFNNVSGNSVEAVVIYIDTGNPATSRLVAYLDSDITGLPITPTNINILLSWNPSGIFSL